MLRAGTVHLLNICSFINTIQAPGNASPHLLLSALGTTDDCVWMLCSWFMEDLSSWRAYKRKVNLTFQMLSFKEHESNRLLHNVESLASRAGCRFFFACFINLIFPAVTHGSWGTFCSVKEVIIFWSSYIWRSRCKMLETRSTFYKEKPEGKKVQ